MLFLLAGTAALVALLVLLRVFERAPAAAIFALAKWIAAFGGIALTILLFLSGRGPQALGGLVLVGPLLWRRWQRFGGGAPGGAAPSPPPRTGSSLSRDEAYDVLGLKPGASPDEIHAAHRRLMRLAHPDAGGSDWLASRVNQARDVLLG